MFAGKRFESSRLKIFPVSLQAKVSIIKKQGGITHVVIRQEIISVDSAKDQGREPEGFGGQPRGRVF